MINTDFEPFPTIKTERLLLRRVVPSDLKDLLALRSNEEAMQYIGRPLAKTMDDANDLLTMIDGIIDKENGIHWGITINNKLIGTIGFWRMDKLSFRTEIGYMLHPTYHRQGMMQEALREVLSYGFDKMNLHSVEARTSPNNIASMRLLEKNGFIREGYLRENFFFEGQFWDTVIFGLLEQKWAAHR